MNSIKEIIVTLAITTILGFGIVSCASLGEFFGEGTVFTTADQLEEGEEAPIVPLDQLPDSVKDKLPEGTTVVMANKDQLKDDAAYIPAGGELDGDSIGGMIDAGFGIASAFIPGLAAWEGIVSVFSQRKRKHYVKAAKAIIPSDKNVDFGSAVGSIASALGMAHSSDASAKAHATEEKKASTNI
tara:strand:- start:2373 stop:2927 length:555 start_codon:yes stop_codon:yes gene_type:complete